MKPLKQEALDQLAHILAYLTVAGILSLLLGQALAWDSGMVLCLSLWYIREQGQHGWGGVFTSDGALRDLIFGWLIGALIYNLIVVYYGL